MTSYPEFNPVEYFTSRSFDQKFITLVMTALDPRKSKRTPTKRELREGKSQNRKGDDKDKNSGDSNIQDRINRLRMRFDEIQPKPEEQPPPKQKPSSISSKAKEEDRSDERAAEIKRRIDEMKSRLARS